MKPAGEYTFLFGKGDEDREFGIFLYKRESYQKLRG
jgi:hypothetical protein